MPPLLPRLCWLLWLFALHAHGFGEQGHRLVAELAEDQLRPEARAEVRRLLAIEGAQSLAAVAVWADQVRDTAAYTHTFRWHFLNFPRTPEGTDPATGCVYNAERDCANGECVVAQIDRHATVLGDRGAPDGDRLEALKFLVHFIGDAHQPLHSGYGDDKGGNDFQINWSNQGSNLHAFWDSGMMRSRELDDAAYRALLATMPEPKPSDADDDAAAWAEESCRILRTTGVYPGRHLIGRDYIERHLPVLESRIVLGARRLAGTLNAALGAR